MSVYPPSAGQGGLVHPRPAESAARLVPAARVHGGEGVCRTGRLGDRRPPSGVSADDGGCDAQALPLEAVIVHSRSRFFRDMYGTLHYERMLRQAGAELFDHQPATDDGRPVAEEPDFDDGRLAGECQAYEPDDEGERAAGGSSTAPGRPSAIRWFLPIPGPRARSASSWPSMTWRHQVAPNFDLYRHGLDGKPMGMKAIATHLNAAGTLMRGRPWRIQKLHDLLGDPTYRGEYRYNMRDSRTGLLRPESEWIRYAVEPIVNAETFEAVRRIREGRDPNGEAPARTRTLTLPTLLTGLLSCEHCGKAMTLATGKSGRYKYYKCCNKMSIGPAVCQTPNLPMEKLDRLILERLVNKVLTPERVTELLKDWLRHQALSQTAVNAKVGQLGPLPAGDR